MNAVVRQSLFTNLITNSNKKQITLSDNNELSQFSIEIYAIFVLLIDIYLICCFYRKWIFKFI